MAYRFLPWLADRRGFLPGRSVGFGGNESCRLIHDWARSALSGRYAADGLPVDLEAEMSRVVVDAHAVALAEEHRQHIGRWYYECSYEIHTGLADMYVADERFEAFYESLKAGLARYLRDAIHANAMMRM